MKQFATSLVIHAPAERIWSLLTNASGYAAWNSTVEKVDGQMALGQKIKVHAKVSPGRAFPVKVTQFEPNRRMVWSGGMPLGLFVGARTYELTQRSAGDVEFSMREAFSGLLAPLITRSIPDLQPDFDQFAADLKKRAEATA